MRAGFPRAARIANSVASERYRGEGGFSSPRSPLTFRTIDDLGAKFLSPKTQEGKIIYTRIQRHTHGPNSTTPDVIRTSDPGDDLIPAGGVAFLSSAELARDREVAPKPSAAMEPCSNRSGSLSLADHCPDGGGRPANRCSW